VSGKNAETPSCWGIFREAEHSPGREADDAEILKETGRKLTASGFAVIFHTPAQILGQREALPSLAFAMCEGLPALERLRQWESRGVCIVNSARAVSNTHREASLPLLERAGIPTPESLVIDTGGSLPRGRQEESLFGACWVKQASEHKTREGDVLFAADRTSVRKALDRLRDRSLPRAVVQRHVAGDVVKFYGVGAPPPASDADLTSDALWFQWFYPREHPVTGHAFDERAFRTVACRAARSLGLDVWGGDAIITPEGQTFVIDLNAWPSFALYRDPASSHIASHLAARLRRFAGVSA